MAKPALSSHGFGLAAILETARSLGALPSDCTVYAVAAEKFDLGEELSPAVAAAARDVAAMIRRDLL